MRLLHPETGDFDAQCRAFRWRVPAHYNIAEQVCCRHREHGHDRPALFYENESGACSRFTFGQLHALSNGLANALAALGISAGDRVAIILPQRPEAALAHLALYKLHAVALPLSVLFGEDAVRYRLADSGARLVITDAAHVEMVHALQAELPHLERIIDCDRGLKDGDSNGGGGLWGLLARAAESFTVAPTPPDTPALLIYTSGTTGPPKGALLAHRCLYGNLSGFELSHDFFPQRDDLFWTPADWAWTGGLIDALLPAWNYGVPVLGYEGGKFDPEKACHLMEKYRVRNAFVPPTALRMIRQVNDVAGRFKISLRSLMSAGETMGAELFHWGREVFGIEFNEMWAQTEFNYIAGNSATILPVRPGSIGKPYPGHRVAPVGEDGGVVAPGEVGELSAWRHDPVMFLGYWKREQATRDKFNGKWFGTGDMGRRDEDGYLWFVGRKDDVISSAGYRIGPGEIEDCLLKHPAVAHAAVIGVPDPDQLRGSVIKAFIVAAPGLATDDALRDSIQQLVRARLASYEYPRQIEFVKNLPMTTTGKVRRMELRRREEQGQG